MVQIIKPVPSVVAPAVAFFIPSFIRWFQLQEFVDRRTDKQTDKQREVDFYETLHHCLGQEN